MLIEVRADGAWEDIPQLSMHLDESIEMDLIQIRDIQGLDFVKAAITTEPYGNVDGVSFAGAKVDTRNIVLTVAPQPDWDTWTISKLRQQVYKYFVPKQRSRLEFYSDDMVPVEISGYVESVETNIFSKDPELQVSIVCPDPHFQAIDLTTHTGTTLFDIEVIPYAGTVETGFNIKIHQGPGGSPGYISVHNTDADDVAFSAVAVSSEGLLSESMYYEMNSVVLNKYVQNVDVSEGTTNLMDKLIIHTAPWTTLRPGNNRMGIYADFGGPHPYEMTYYARYGGL